MRRRSIYIQLFTVTMALFLVSFIITGTLLFSFMGTYLTSRHEKELDNIDKSIIRILQENARTPVKDIAKEVFLSSPAVSARIERLEKRGILTGYHATVNPMLFGYHIKAFINLEVEPAQKKEFYPFIDRIPNVIECNCVTGDYAMLVEVMFQTTIQLDHFINELQHFGRTKTLIVFSTSVEHRDVPVN